MNNQTLLNQFEESQAKIVLLTVGLLILFFPTVILGIDSFFYRDFGVIAYPIIYHWKRSILSGELPLWNPLSHCGVPFIAQWGTMPFYPFAFIYLILPLPFSLNFFCFLHLILGAAGMYLLTKRWTGKDSSALISGIGFVFNGAVLSSLMWPNYTAALGWLPWAVYSTELALEKGGRFLLYSIIISSFQYLTGVPELILITQFIIFCLVLLNIKKNCFWIYAGRYLVCLIAPILLCAIQLLPFIYLYLNSQRQLSIDVNKWAMPGWGWANFIIPLFHYYETYQHTFVQTNQAFLTSYYYPSGLIILFLITIFSKRDKKVNILILITLFSLVLAIGNDGYLFKYIFENTPVINKVRYPVKFILMTAFTIPVLAGYGIKSILDYNRGTIKIIISFIFILILGSIILWFNYKYPFEYDQFGLIFKNSITRFIILFLFIISIITFIKYRLKILFYISLLLISYDGVKHMPNFHPKLPSESFTPGLWEQSVAAKRFGISDGRVFISREAEEKLLRSTVSDWSANFIGKRLALWSNLNLIERIPKVNGAFTLQIKYQKEIENLIYDKNNTNINNLLKILGVKWITRPGTVIEWTNYIGSSPIISAGQSVSILSDDFIKDLLVSTEIDPEAVVFISECEVEKQPEIKQVKGTKVSIFNKDISNHKISVEYETALPSILFISQSYYPLWKAYIDGKKIPLLRANYAFQSVYLPEGRHKLIIKYEDNYFITGMIISFFITGILYFQLMFKSKKTP